jgi:putative ABC transport system permease protein
MNPEFANSFVNEIREMSEVESAAGSLSVPGIGVVWEESYLKEGEAGLVATKTMIVGDNFAEVLDLTVLEGKLFSENTMDTSNVLLNELAVKVFNLKEPIGATIRRSNNDGSESAFTVIGVVKDFNYDYLYNEIQPLVMQSNETIFKRVSSIVARVKPNATASAIKNIETKWKERRPGEPYTFKFVDEVVDSFYKKEQRLSRIFKILSGLSTFIACLGLFALSTQMVSLRTKEISVRKISGASTWSILVLILKYFTIMVLISFVVAVPFAYYGLERWWLTGFAYRTSIGIVPILSAGVIALILAWVSVAFQTIRAARINPVQYLGRE